MKKVVILLTLAFGILGCRSMIEDIKVMKRIRKIVLANCDCKYAVVEKDREDGLRTMRVTISKWWSDDHLLTAENVYTAVQDSFPKICDYGKFFVIFENEEFDERFTFYGCDFESELDTIFYEGRGDDEDLYDDEEWDEFMEDEDSTVVI